MSGGSDFMMIGLHKLASQNGDGLIPELLVLYKHRGASMERATLPASMACVAEDENSMTQVGNDNVISLRPYLLARKGR